MQCSSNAAEQVQKLVIRKQRKRQVVVQCMVKSRCRKIR